MRGIISRQIVIQETLGKDRHSIKKNYFRIKIKAREKTVIVLTITQETKREATLKSMNKTKILVPTFKDSMLVPNNNSKQSLQFKTKEVTEDKPPKTLAAPPVTKPLSPLFLFPNAERIDGEAVN